MQWHYFALVFLLLCQSIAHLHGKLVRDVDSSILEEIQQNPSNSYLIQFHAPWCGHCRKFEPIYEEIAEEVAELSKTVDEYRNLHLVRLDATVYTDVANHYDIRGYPTIKFIHQSRVLSFENERTKSALLKFIKRVNGPSIRWISSAETFDQIRQEHEVFFLLFTNNNDDPLTNEYQRAVDQYVTQAYFYATNDSHLEQTYLSSYRFENQAQVFVVKTEGLHLYQPNEYHSNLEEFIVKEQLVSFPKVTKGNIRDLVLTKKILIIYAYENDTDDRSNELKVQLQDQIYRYVVEHLSTYRETFQLAWSTDLDLLNHIAVWTLTEPLFFLYNSNEHKYGVYPLSSTINENTSIASILDHLRGHASEIIHFTGDTWFKRFVRPFWELYRTIAAMFIEAPTVSMFVIGLPAAMLSIICYCLCCLPNEESTMGEMPGIPDISDDSDDSVEDEQPSSIPLNEKKDQ